MPLDRDDLQILRFEIIGLGRKFAAQIIPRADELDTGIRKAFESLAADGRLEQIIEEAAVEALQEAVKAVVGSHEIQQAMKRRCLAALESSPGKEGA